MGGTEPVWAVTLQGPPFDVEQWLYLLPKGGDPWTTKVGEAYVLRSTSFDRCKKPSDVLATASVLIEKVNGARVASDSDACAVSIGAVVEVQEDGSLQRHVMLAGTIGMGLRASAYLTVGDDPSQNVPSRAQKWVARANDDPDRSDLLIYIARSDNWFDIYKAIECVEAILGGEKGLIASGIVPAGQIKLLKQTANTFARHADRKFTRPQNPMSIADARNLIGVLAGHVFRSVPRLSLHDDD